MQHRILRVAILSAASLVLVLQASAAPAYDAMDFSSPREKGMGGRHVALADDFSVLLANPAGLADAPRSFSAADLGVQVMGPVFDIATLFSGGIPSTAQIINFLSANDYKLFAGADISGPLALGYTGGGLGFGLFNKSRMTVNVASASSIQIKAVEDLLLSSGYAYRFDLGKGHDLALGVSFKGFVIGEIATTKGIVEAMAIKDDPMSLLSSTFTFTTGIGVDTGLRWSWKDTLAAGLVYRDAYSPAISTDYSNGNDFLSDPNAAKLGAATYGTLPSSLDFGFMWKPRLGRLSAVLDSLTLALDYKDILGLFDPIPRNPILNAGIGLELSVLEIVSLRVGVSDALLNAGATLDLGIFRLNFAAFGTELGLDPGNRPGYNLLVDFDFKY